MLTPNEYDHLTDQLMHLYWDLDDAILADITRRLTKTGGEYLPFSAAEQAKRMQQAGLLYEDIITEITKRSGMTTRQVAKTFERAGVQSIRNDNRFYQAAGLEGIIKLSDAALQTLNAGYQKCNGELQNLTLTTANTAQTAYLHACDLAYMEVSTGTLDYGTAIRNVIRSAAEQGSYVLYPSGHRDRLDVAVRRSVLTGVGQTVRTLSEINAGDMGCDLMEISAHAGARPSHAEWQGQIVSLSGRRGYLSKKDIGYGSGDGFGGWNCRHDWYPFFEGISHRVYTNEDLKRLNEPHIDLGDGKLYTDYEVSQMQRALERDVRRCKRSTVAFQTALDEAQDDKTRQTMQAEYTDAAVRLKASEKKLHDFCKQTDSLEDGSRVWVNGFGQSEAQRAVHANNRSFQQSMIEKGIKNPPKSLAMFEKMRYNNPKEYELMQTYLRSVDNGMLSPLAGYDLYKEYHERIETEVIGMTAADGTVIRSQSKHFLERVFGTMDDPSHGGVKRSGVELDDVIDALKNGKPIFTAKHPDSIVFRTDRCSVSLNTEAGNLIQVTPRSEKEGGQ